MRSVHWCIVIGTINREHPLIDRSGSCMHMCIYAFHTRCRRGPLVPTQCMCVEGPVVLSRLVAQVICVIHPRCGMMPRFRSAEACPVGALSEGALSTVCFWLTE